jgi:Tol biopolymer transport system component
LTSLPNAALYSTTPTGTQVRKLTATSGRIDLVAASPDGREIAYSAETYGYGKHGKNWHVTGDYVHVVNADGTDDRTVYRCQAATCSSLNWSPIGGRLLIDDGTILAPDGHLTKLCSDACGPADTLSEASWSPDGKEIAFEDSVTVAAQGGTATVTAIGLAHADGTHIQLLTDRQCTNSTQALCTYDSSPAWSPSGDEIAFQRLKTTILRRDGNSGLGPFGSTSIDTMRTDGTGVTQLTSCGSDCQFESIQWAAEGDRLAFVSTEDPLTGSPRLSTVGVADTSTHRMDTMTIRTVLTDLKLVPAVAWAPSGGELALENDEPGHPATISLVPVHDATLGSAVPLIGHNAYPPLTWLPIT